MINNEIDGAQWVDFSGVTTKSVHAVSHGSEIDNSRHTCEILKDNARGAERNLGAFLGRFLPVENGLNIGLFHLVVVAVTDGGFKEDSDRVRKLFDSGVAEGWKLVEVVLLAGVLESSFNSLVEGVGLGTGCKGAGSG